MKHLFIYFLLFYMTVYAQDPVPYQWYTSDGKKINFSKVIKKVSKEADILFFGELHNNSIAHWMQLEAVRRLDQEHDLILGAEMFERDQQEFLEAYLQGSITAEQLADTITLWSNYATDYAPLVNYARDNNIAFAGTNIPRRYASAVFRGGFEVLDTLTEKEKGWLPALPVPYDPDLPGYKAMLDMMPGHGGENLPKAQAIKDATMAWFIKEYFMEDSLFIHFNGAYHSDNYEGIIWYLNEYRPGLEIVTFSTATSINATWNTEWENKADYILVVNEDIPGSY